MAQFDDLQHLWQGQTVAVAERVNAASLTGDFRRFGRRQDLINGGKCVVVAVQVYLTVSRLHSHPVEMFGALLAGFSALYFLLREWRNQRAVAGLDFAAPSADFVRSAIARLNALRNPFQGREFYIMMGGFWLGCTTMIVARWPRLPLWQIVLWHAGLTLLPFAAYRPAVYLRGKRWNLECRPLVERLTGLLESIEECSE
jgi:hypothetical protein